MTEIPNFTIARDILYRQVEQEAVLLHITSGMYYSLNETGVLFWEALRDQPPTQAGLQIVERIAQDYEVDSAQVEQDLMLFLKDLAEYGIITWTAHEQT
ncbi:PqqD family protein [Candidatus Cyanaurora vandensis]|uniref:PqqD family protein n=1 Tax=Candidatus Cyanaurora vandensis TaxID=2714958 RepID=UPI00257BF134|nr:PqqD family protein [Candidatus Cyanaurora vandensis]